ncbi:tRNA (N6-threonylcarbamoyladenosine(37)-N6)-methyltransferase TrmO [Pseudidiomarina mangrovi]|uniref:tRNA (N6-threonylcarbamoyladenosine(37)-N6)-methyltransferase TrmO n=1 Tax=Pseudidiomarina mangrovi TaxID=2487133 RepID=UPI000FCA195B|nr:tRNA (N6-threonylcarbamoyladenosine(37)-N6)-methyltransferase TrmO [Pseudidiomarina mangrovi]
MTFSIEAIGEIRSPYQQKFAVPRQPGLVTAACAEIHLHGDYAHPDSVRGLTEFSHIWVLFIFHETVAAGWQPLVRPPRLGGNTRKGVFATRATYRPNGIGMSVVKLESVQADEHGVIIRVRGADWVNGTPVIDIKPYLPYAESISNAQGGFADARPHTALTTVFSTEAEQQLCQLEPHYLELRLLISQVLNQDPRPAYKKAAHQEKVYGMSLYDLNIKWQVSNGENQVIQISKDF